MVGAAGFEPARAFGQWGLSPSRLTKVTPRPRTIHSNYDYAKPGLLPMSNDSDSDARRIQATNGWRRRADSNRRITDLQSAALPLGYGAVLQLSRRIVAYLRDTIQRRRCGDGLMRSRCVDFGGPRRQGRRGCPWHPDPVIWSQGGVD